MDQIKIGKFIADTRSVKKLTQEELAKEIGVTNKAISKWENGRCLPDVSLFKPLCKALDISVNELLTESFLSIASCPPNIFKHAQEQHIVFKEILNKK